MQSDSKEKEKEQETHTEEFELEDGWERISFENITQGDIFADVFMDSSVKKQKYKPLLVETHIRKSDGQLRHFFSNVMLKTGDCCIFFRNSKITEAAIAICSCFATRIGQVHGPKYMIINTEPPPDASELEPVDIPLWIVKQRGEDIVADRATVGARCVNVPVTIDTTKVLFDPYTTAFFSDSGMGIIRDKKVPQLISGIVCDGDKNTDPTRVTRMKAMIQGFNNRVSQVEGVNH